MSKIVKVSNSDYRVQVKSGGKIWLDVGTSPDTWTRGTVIITGNLDVQGVTTTVESTTTTIADGIITLNKGQTGAGIGLIPNNYQSGIEIDRGTLPKAKLVFDESVTHYDSLVAANVPGTFVLQTSDGALSGLQLASIGTSDLSDFYFDMNNSNRILKIINSPNYSTFVLDDNDIPNKKYINDYVSAHGGIADVDRFFYLAVPGQTQGKAYSNYIDFTVMNSTRATITESGLNVDSINLFGDVIKNSSLGNNLKLTANNNIVEVDAFIQLDDVGSTPTAVSGSTTIYTKDSDTTPAPGKTGIYFTNLGNSDELVAKNRALLFSILF